MIPSVMDMSCPYFTVVFTETSKEDKLPTLPPHFTSIVHQLVEDSCWAKKPD